MKFEIVLDLKDEEVPYEVVSMNGTLMNNTTLAQVLVAKQWPFLKERIVASTTKIFSSNQYIGKIGTPFFVIKRNISIIDIKITTAYRMYQPHSS